MKDVPIILYILGQEQVRRSEESGGWRVPGDTMFNDTTRLRLRTRPALRDLGQGRLGASQSFREKMSGPVRPRDPPPPPPLDQNNSKYSLAKKLFSFNKTEIRRINRFLGISDSDPRAGQNNVSDKNIYDIAENDEHSSEIGVTVVNNSTFYTGPETAVTTCPGPEVLVPRPGASVKKNISFRMRPRSNEFSPDPVKPPRSKRERSQSFTPRSNPSLKTSLFNRSLSQTPKSSSNNSLTGGAVGKLVTATSDDSKKLIAHNNANDDPNETKRTFSSSDLVTIFPDDEERRSFKDIRKILSSPSISSSSSCSSSSAIYRPMSGLSNPSLVINNSIREEQIVVSTRAKDISEHIYEEIRDKEDLDNNTNIKRPLPPLPSETHPRQSPSRSSPARTLSEQSTSSPVKSIFEGASKYEILNYLEDARERGLTDCDLDLEEEEEEEDAGNEVDDSVASVMQESTTAVILAQRNHNHKVSHISTESCDTAAAPADHHDTLEEARESVKEKLSAVDIERNDSGLGSETGRSRSVSKVVVRKRSEQESEELSCLDCDAVLGQQEGDK